MILKIKNKMKSESGVSFLFAMLTFLVAAMVSVTIVTAATTTIKRVHNDRKEQQELLTLTSAAQLIRDEMYKTKYVITQTITKENGVVVSNVTEKSCEGVFKPEIKAAVETVQSGSSYSSASDAISVEVEGVEMQVVKASFNMSNEETKKYKVVFTISAERSGKIIFLTMLGKETASPPVESENKTINVTTISWDSPSISSLGE